MTLSGRIFKHQGIALIQALLVSALLSTVLISFVYVAKQAQYRAETALNRAEALFRLETTQSQIELALLTNSQNIDVPKGRWNAYSEPFSLEYSSVQVQDLNGLFMVGPSGTIKFNKLLEALGYSVEKSKMAAAALNDWQDVDNHPLPGGGEQEIYDSYDIRNAPLQTISELRFVANVEVESFSILKNVVTLYPTRGFNPLTAPSVLLNLYMPASQVSKINALRQQNLLDANELFKITGLSEGDDLTTVPGPGYRISFICGKEDVMLTRSFEATFNPYLKDPIQRWQYQRLTLTHAQ